MYRCNGSRNILFFLNRFCTHLIENAFTPLLFSAYYQSMRLLIDYRQRTRKSPCFDYVSRHWNHLHGFSIFIKISCLWRQKTRKTAKLGICCFASSTNSWMVATNIFMKQLFLQLLERIYYSLPEWSVWNMKIAAHMYFYIIAVFQFQKIYLNSLEVVKMYFSSLKPIVFNFSKRPRNYNI